MNTGYKLLFYCPVVKNCNCFRKLIENNYTITTCATEKSFLKSLKKRNPDAGIICLYNSGENEINEFLRLELNASKVPLISCTKELEADFITKATQKGIHRFLSAKTETGTIITLIDDVIKKGDLINFIEQIFPACFDKITYAKKIIAKIIEKFPHRISEDEIAKEINVSARWVYQQCKKAFDVTYIELIRIIWVYQAIRLIEKTDLDNNEIAIMLNYTEESNMARDFRKVLGINPTEVRKNLNNITAKQLFKIANF